MLWNFGVFLSHFSSFNLFFDIIHFPTLCSIQVSKWGVYQTCIQVSTPETTLTPQQCKQPVARIFSSFFFFKCKWQSKSATQLVKWQLEEGWSWDRKAHTGGWICQWGYMDFLKLLQGFVKVVMSHSQMLGKFEYGLPAKFWRLVGCTEMLSW